MRRNVIVYVLAAFSVAFLITCCSPCGTPTGSSPKTSSPKWQLYKLYFGMSSDRGDISEQDFKNFLDTAITIRFPEGLTIYDASGQWNEKNQILHEKTKVIEIAAYDSSNVLNKVNAIRTSYKTIFHQSSVLLIRENVLVDF